MVNATLRTRRHGGVNARYYNYRAHQLGKVLVKRIGTALMWSVVLAAGGWLAGCAVPKSATGNQKPEVNGVEKPLLFAEKNWDINNMTLHNLKVMSAEEIYSLTPTQLQKLKDNTSEFNPMSEQDWKNITQIVQGYHPLMVYYTRLHNQTLNGCNIFKPPKLGATLSTVFIPTSFSKLHPEYIVNEYEVFGNKKGVRRYIGPITNESKVQPKNPFICVEDYKNSSRSSFDQTALKGNNPDLGCEVFIMVPYIAEQSFFPCPDSNYIATGNHIRSSHFCRLQARVFEAAITCQEFSLLTVKPAD